MSHIFDCEKTRKLRQTQHKVYGINSVFGDKVSWRKTRFKVVAYISNLLGSNNVKYNVLGKETKEMLNIVSVPS